jgi:hypothetical protein
LGDLNCADTAKYWLVSLLEVLHWFWKEIGQADRAQTVADIRDASIQKGGHKVPLLGLIGTTGTATVATHFDLRVRIYVGLEAFG